MQCDQFVQVGLTWISSDQEWNYYTRQPYVEGAFSYSTQTARIWITTPAAPILIQAGPQVSRARRGAYGRARRPRAGATAAAVRRPKAGPHLMQ